jgi:hypothetical protein
VRNIVKFLPALFGALFLLISAPVCAQGHHHSTAGLADATVLIIRHAEDAASGPGLSSAGQARAQAYARYFLPFRLGRETLHIDALIAAADGRHSQRPRLTLEPLSRASGLAIEQRFEDSDTKGLARWLGEGRPGRTILISWRHGDIPKLIGKLGVDPATLLHHGAWSGHVYDRVVVLRFDHSGTIVPSACVVISEPSLVN